jgi:hypothetical protein
MLPCQLISFLNRKLREAQLDIAANNGPSRCAKAVSEPTDCFADAESNSMRQQANQSQAAKTDPGWPVFRGKILVQGFTVFGHRTRSL